MILFFIAVATGYLFGGLSVYYGIRQWRKELGYKPDPLSLGSIKEVRREIINEIYDNLGDSEIVSWEQEDYEYIVEVIGKSL